MTCEDVSPSMTIYLLREGNASMSNPTHDTPSPLALGAWARGLVADLDDGRTAWQPADLGSPLAVALRRLLDLDDVDGLRATYEAAQAAEDEWAELQAVRDADAARSRSALARRAIEDARSRGRSCPHCGAAPGERCTVPSGGPTPDHSARRHVEGVGR